MVQGKTDQASTHLWLKGIHMPFEEDAEYSKKRNISAQLRGPGLDNRMPSVSQNKKRCVEFFLGKKDFLSFRDF